MTARRRPLRIAHRGYRTMSEENSLRQIAHALELGCDMIETDVRRRSDGVLVLDHDTAERPGAATLADALALIAASTAGVNLDLKVGGLTDDIVRHVREAGLLGRAACTGGGWEQLAAIRRVEPGIRVGLTIPRRSVAGIHALGWLATRIQRVRWSRAIPELLASHGADLVTVEHRLVDRMLVQSVHRAGAEIWCWTVDDPRALRRLEALGVDGVCSNHPESHGLVV